MRQGNHLYESLLAEGFFPHNPQVVRTWYGILAVLALLTFNPVLFIASLTFGRGMPRKTMFGAEAAAVARSLRNFLASQEEKLKFQAKNQLFFEKLLPYAVAFGVEDQWAKRFAQIPMTQPEWYVSKDGDRFNSVVLANSISHGYRSSFAAADTYRSSSGFSSGFSGGGGSSGGGGGGGGGSW